MLIDEIKKANMVALKNKDADARAIYSVIMNKYLLLSISKRDKHEEATDADLIALIQKTLKEIDDEKESFEKAGKAERVAGLKHQSEVLSSYLPKMLTEEEIKAEILKLDDRSIPAVMKHFKTNFAGKVNMATVNKVAKSL